MALARALVTQPAVLLLDEPLGALDEKLRLEMQSELVDIQRSLGVTFVYITHSQEEALTMSDRVILMRAGRIEQSGTPVELFDRPVSRFAAEFMGFENLLPCIVRGPRERTAAWWSPSAIFWSAAFPRRRPALPKARRRWSPCAPSGSCPRPERSADGLNVVPCMPASQLYRGKYVDQIADTPIGQIRLRNWDRTAAAERLRRRDVAGGRLRGASTLEPDSQETGRG